MRLKDPTQLTIKEKRFVKEYVRTLNATSAAKIVYQNKYADRLGNKMKQKPKIKNAIEEAFRELDLNEDFATRNLKKIIEKGTENADAARPGDALKGIETFLKVKGYLSGGTANPHEQEREDVKKMDATQIMKQLAELDKRQAALINILKGNAKEAEYAEENPDKPVQPEHQ